MVGTRVFKHSHLLAPNNDKLLLFVRMKPADKDMSPRTVIKQQIGNGYVGNVRLQVSATRCRYLKRCLSDQGQNHRDVMGRKAPQRILLTADLSHTEPV